MSVSLILFIVALILFVIATLMNLARVSLIPLGLAFLTAALMAPHLFH